MTFNCSSRHYGAYETDITNSRGEKEKRIICPDCGYMASPDKFKRLKT